MDFRQMEAFVNVVKLKSFSKAADVLFLTQPTISSHISGLEKELGVVLIDRANKEICATKQGRVLYNYAKEMINMRETALSTLNGDGNTGFRDILEITASSVPAQYILPGILFEFSQTNRHSKFIIDQTDSRQVIRKVSDNEFEIGITGLKSNSNRFVSECIAEDKLVLITPASERYAQYFNTELNPDIFIKEQFIYREDGSATRKKFEKYLESYGIGSKYINIIAIVNNTDIVMKSVVSGLGVAIVSKIVAQQFAQNNDIFIFELKESIAERKFYLIYPQNRTLSPLAKSFSVFLKNRCRRGNLLSSYEKNVYRV